MRSKGHGYGLNQVQKEAVLHTEGPLLIVAGAGAGKTKTITHRMVHLIEQGVPPWNILALTFTNKAAGEMRERVRRLLPGHPGGLPLLTTFHALGARLLREFHAEAELPRAFSIWDRDDSVRAVKRVSEAMGIGEPAPRSILSTLSHKKGGGLSAGEFAGEAKNYRERSVAEVWGAYEKTLAEEGAVDFDDLLLKTLALLRDKPEILAKLRARWTHLTVDEYQDTNRAQYEIARLLAGERKNLCVVGDSDQNIYSWRGAQMEHLLQFEEQFPGTKVVLLEQNYRSTRTILTAANAVIEKNTRRNPKRLFTENETGEPILFYRAADEADEAWFVAERTRRLIESGVPAREIAVLYRENFQSRALEEAFLHLDVPYRVLGVRFFERKEVRDVLSYLRAAQNPNAKTDLQRIVGVPARGIGNVTLKKMLSGQDASLPKAAQSKVAAFRGMLASIKKAVDVLPASEAVRFALEASGIEKMLKEDAGDGRERLENAYELVNLATRYDDYEPPTGIERLLEEAALESEQDALPVGEDNAINAAMLMTMHAAKGLEFDMVFITGLEQGLFPSAHSDESRDPEEERRLFYVALTRARKRLFLSQATARLKYGSREYALPSEFLEDIDPRLIRHARVNEDTHEEETVR